MDLDYLCNVIYECRFVETLGLRHPLLVYPLRNRQTPTETHGQQGAANMNLRLGNQRSATKNGAGDPQLPCREKTRKRKVLCQTFTDANATKSIVDVGHAQIN